MSSVARLGPDLLVYKDHIVLNLIDLEKQSRPGNIRGYLRVQNFLEDDTLCPVSTLVEYNQRVSVLQPNRSSFFVSYVKPHNCVSSKTLSRWILTLLSSSGIDTSTFKAHSTRSAAGVLLQKSMSYVQICKLADWSMKSGVFERFYLRYL